MTDPVITDHAVEAGARALAAEKFDRLWEDLGDSHRAWCRRRARVVLDAALGVLSPQTNTDEARRGMDLILAERRRQIEQEGWTPEHDDEHGPQVLARAAHCYWTGQVAEWPWDLSFWKPKTRPLDLIRAGALYLAAAESAERLRIPHVHGSDLRRFAAKIARELDDWMSWASSSSVPQTDEVLEVVDRQTGRRAMEWVYPSSQAALDFLASLPAKYHKQYRVQSVRVLTTAAVSVEAGQHD